MTGTKNEKPALALSKGGFFAERSARARTLLYERERSLVRVSEVLPPRIFADAREFGDEDGIDRSLLDVGSDDRRHALLWIPEPHPGTEWGSIAKYEDALLPAATAIRDVDGRQGSVFETMALDGNQRLHPGQRV